mgnify:CR=1 FL=1
MATHEIIKSPSQSFWKQDPYDFYKYDISPDGAKIAIIMEIKIAKLLIWIVFLAPKISSRNPNIKDIINSKIKRRESFRPFAPSILANHVKEWFEIDKEVPFMSEVYSMLETKRDILPGITHVDGTGRLQTVSEENNAKYYLLIKNFYEKTGVPIILNTSFNENEPIVQTPAEAIDCFTRTNMDVLVIEDWIITR